MYEFIALIAILALANIGAGFSDSDHTPVTILAFVGVVLFWGFGIFELEVVIVGFIVAMLIIMGEIRNARYK